jgi:DNA mismatch repair protein MutS2
MIPKISLEILEFNKLLSLISGFANSEASKVSVLDIQPLLHKTDIEKRLRQISEVRKISHEGNSLSLYPFSDISHLIGKIRPEGAVLDAIELADFIPILSIASAVSLQLGERDDLPFLREITDHLTGFPDILNILKKSLDSEGNIFDSASFLLADLRAQIRKLEGKIRKKLEEIVRDERVSVFLQDDFVTKRSGRWVIPVRMDSKGMVPGVVHDISKSGETAFIEPLSIISLSNEMENLIADQKAEELRILRKICSMIRSVADDIMNEFHTVVYLDVLNCIARFADMLQMEAPQINESNSIHLIGARHPLLQLSLKKTGSTQLVVPLDVQLGGDSTVMVITGANAGGKTIAIKTIGLLMLMTLSGIPLPADSSSSLPFVQSLLVDIGDEQSIENNLSTFSAHISNISEILKNKDSKTVILIDELGTGTDPDEGAALACAVLKEIRKSGALVFATTHLADIKGFVHRAEGMVNASMEFDLKTYTPMYRLRIGEPGQSHALEIAKRYGLPESLIDDAKSLLGSMKIELDHMISEMNRKRLGYETALNNLQQQQTEIADKNRLLEKMLSDAKEKQKEILANAFKEASDVISDTKRQMNAFLDEMKKKEKSERQKIMKKVETTQEYVTRKIREFDLEDKGAPALDDIKSGDTVYVKSLGYDASVIGINRKNNRMKVMAKNMEIEVPVTDISFKRGKSLPAVKYSSRTDKAEETVSSRINLVGSRVDEALSRLEYFLNHASLAELSEVTIIHGIGKGLLSRAIHEHLNEHPLVKHYRTGTIEEGGSGVTVVTMK